MLELEIFFNNNKEKNQQIMEYLSEFKKNLQHEICIDQEK